MVICSELVMKILLAWVSEHASDWHLALAATLSLNVCRAHAYGRVLLVLAEDIDDDFANSLFEPFLFY